MAKSAERIDMRARTKDFALRVINVFSALPKHVVAEVLGKQFLRSGTSVGAHYRESFRARSSAEYISKIEVALQELEETSYWFELLIQSKIIKESKLSALMAEANELTAILVSCAKTAKSTR